LGGVEARSDFWFYSWGHYVFDDGSDVEDLSFRCVLFGGFVA
jgi:hypothetical protein